MVESGGSGQRGRRGGKRTPDRTKGSGWTVPDRTGGHRIGRREVDGWEKKKNQRMPVRCNVETMERRVNDIRSFFAL